MRYPRALAVLALLSLAGCFEDPVSETLVIEMLEEDYAAVTATVALQSGPKEGPLFSRLQQLKADYANGHDAWTRRFERAQLEHEERTLIRDRHDRNQGEVGKPGDYLFDLTKVKHKVVIPRRELGFLLSDSGVSVDMAGGRGMAELLIVPGGGTLSTPEQRRALKKHLEGWAGSAVQYLEATRRLYSYLDSSPDRATAVFGELFEDLSDDPKGSSGELTDDEKPLVESVRGGMEAMANELGGLEEVPYGLNELSYLVYDPLPAAVTVCIPKAADEVEGFIPEGDLCYSIPRRGVIDAFDALDGRWISPDPFVYWIRIHRSQGQEKLDLPGFAAKRRAAVSVPAASEILKALEDGMRHETSYRLRWIETGAGG